MRYINNPALIRDMATSRRLRFPNAVYDQSNRCDNASDTDNGIADAKSHEHPWLVGGFKCYLTNWRVNCDRASRHRSRPDYVRARCENHPSNRSSLEARPALCRASRSSIAFTTSSGSTFSFAQFTSSTSSRIALDRVVADNSTMCIA